MSNTSLASTERRLVTLFVGGAFLFLIIFESVFLLSRIFLEERYSATEFVDEIARIERRGPRIGEGTISGEMRRIPRPPSGLGFLTLEGDGTISGGQFGPEMELKEVISSLDKNYLITIPADTLMRSQGLLYYKKRLLDGSGQHRIFIRKAGYPIDDIFRDILRFLALDIVILVPFYFMGRYFVRETLEPVERNIDTMNHFIHDAGHELKTPLAIVSGNLQYLRDAKKADPEIVDESISIIMGMTGSLDGLLELTSLSLPTEIQAIILEDAIDEEIRFHRDSIEKKQITLKKSIRANTKFPIEKKHFSLLFGNLLKNAITYNKEGGEIEISGDSKHLSIRDTGIGIEPDELQKIWERFYRADRSGKIAGNGIGLSIVDRITKLYGGRIEVSSEKGVGTIFDWKLRA